MNSLKVVSVLATTLLLSACTATFPTAEPSLPASSTAPTAAVGLLPLSGEFVSQGAQTSGTVSITASSDTEFTIKLAQFSTADNGDLRMWLSTGKLVAGQDGAYYVDGAGQLELPGKIDAGEANQSFVFPIDYLHDLDVHSFTVYDYANKMALGSAALG